MIHYTLSKGTVKLNIETILPEYVYIGTYNSKARHVSLKTEDIVVRDRGYFNTKLLTLETATRCSL